jgi:Leucine-rich repeat (LRR) protein
LRSPSLTAINLTSCPALSRIDITSSSLEKLQLRQQLGLASMVLQCPWLREVDLTECELLTDTVCNVFSDGGGCPRLNSLTLDNCDVCSMPS